METSPLSTVIDRFGTPDPKIVSKLPKGGISLSYVGHAEVTRMLLATDPFWHIEPAQLDEAGLPARTKIGNMIQAGFWMTVCGHTRYCVGSVEDRKHDIGKELVSDAIRNGAMRFGFCLSLWSKEEWNDTPTATPKVEEPGYPVEKAVIDKFIKACVDANVDYEQVADHAQVDLSQPVFQRELARLRQAFKKLKAE